MRQSDSNSYYVTIVALLRFFAICATCLSLFCVASIADSSSDKSVVPNESQPGNSLPQAKILFVLMCQSQQSGYHKARCGELRRHLEGQKAAMEATGLGMEVALAEDLVDPFVETFYYLPILVKNHSSLSAADFVFFCQEETRVNVTRLLALLAGYNASQPVFLGSQLQDHGLYITHHFSQSKHYYPFEHCGFALSRALVMSLALHFNSDRSKLEEHEFRIDPAYELANLISVDLQLANLTALDTLCPLCAANSAADASPERCVSWTTGSFRLPECESLSDSPAPSTILSRTLFAVKTHQANFDTVLPVLRDTWGKDALNLKFYADVDDPTVPAVSCGVPNTARGHCDKFNRILALASKEIPPPESKNPETGTAAKPEESQASSPAGKDKNATKPEEAGGYDWLVICDDDTLLSVPRLARLLSCYNTREQMMNPIVIGEKYGYLSSDGLRGYAYPTGGSGLALNRAALLRLTGNPGETRCGSAESPDDMSFGVWLRNLKIPLLHSHLLHQARPVEYSPQLLAAQLPISFHKHYDIDPRKVYLEWLHHHDSINSTATVSAEVKPSESAAPGGASEEPKREEL